jgi:hypothetical protein
MADKTRILVWVCCTLLLAGGCRMQKDKQIKLDLKPGLVTFVDSTEASVAIIKDDSENFFQNLSETEVMIQMKRSEPFNSREEAQKAFAQFTARQVSSWSTEEKLEMSEIMYRVKKMCDSINPRIFPGGIRLVKIKTFAYGNDAYYTRGNDIMIPENIFPLTEPQKQIPVMLHEIFHIISRQNSRFRDAAYRMIGFERAEKPVLLPEHIRQVLLSNPDGLSMDHIIRLRDGKETRLCLPLLTSKYGRYRDGIPSYFDYLQFDIFEVKDTTNRLVVNCTSNGGTTLPARFTNDYFRQIRDNTQYIIHPDEIMADNFMLAVQSFNGGGYDRFSTEGKNLIDELTRLLQDL